MEVKALPGASSPHPVGCPRSLQGWSQPGPHTLEGSGLCCSEA